MRAELLALDKFSWFPIFSIWVKVWVSYRLWTLLHKPGHNGQIFCARAASVNVSEVCASIDLLGNNCIPFAEVCDKHNGIAAVIFDSGKS